MESILTSIKKMLGIREDYESFDADIIMHINSVFMILSQLGVGPPDGFSIKDKSVTWDEYLPDSDEEKLSAVKSYMGQKVRMLFDPPTSSIVLESMNRITNELEWRLMTQAEMEDK